MCGQGALRVLPAELGLGAEAGLRSLQPQECSTHLLPWQPRHCQTSRMCEDGEDGGVVGAETGATERRGSVGVCVCVCAHALWRDVWEMAAERMTVCSLLYLGASYPGCHVWLYAD